MMLAQRYPTTYDGILAGAPAINWAKFIVAEYWPQFIMTQLNTFPPQCVFEAITNATIEACDDLDGAVDGIVSAPQSCQFDPHTLVGQVVQCNGSTSTITANGALIAQKIWQGFQSREGDFLWYGLEPGAPFDGLAYTACTGSSNCQPQPFQISIDWMGLFVLQNPDFDFTGMTYEQYVTIFYESVAGYTPIISTDNPDLSGFKNAGGKLIHWHGLADQLIFPQGSENYYERVEALDSSVRDFYRFFEAPGVQHCAGGSGPAPQDALGAVVAWVENGQAPDTLAAVSDDGTISRNLCPYPLVAAYESGDVYSASSYSCKKQFK